MANPDPHPHPHPSPPVDRTEAFSRLRALGGRLTSSRRELVEAFFESDDGVTAEELIRRHPQFDESTIYRALGSLQQAGIIEHAHLGHGPATYRRAGSPTIPVVCEDCGFVVHIPRQEFDDLSTRLRENYGFVADSYHFAITGHCRSCTGAMPERSVHRGE